MKMSKMYIRTLREVPAEAVILSLISLQGAIPIVLGANLGTTCNLYHTFYKMQT